MVAALPKLAHPGAIAAPKEIYNAEDRHADVDHRSHPGLIEHWIHGRTTNPIESTFATVRLRMKLCSFSLGTISMLQGVELNGQRWRGLLTTFDRAMVRPLNLVA